MHLAAVSGAVDDEEAKMLGAIQIDSNSSTRTATCRLPSGQLLPLSPKHQVRSPVLSILCGLLPREGEATILNLPEFQGSAGQNYSILLDWNALIADQAALEAQQVEIETLLRLLVVCKSVHQTPSWSLFLLGLSTLFQRPCHLASKHDPMRSTQVTCEPY